MYQTIRTRVIVLCLSVLIFCQGCGKQNTVPVHTEEIQTVTQEIKLPVLDSEVKYEIPLCTVNVLVDRNGYQSQRSKKVFFIGDDLASDFSVVNVDTKEIVYTGEIHESVRDDEHAITISKGDFSDVMMPGNYYIETAKIGRSFPFEITDDVEENMLQNVILSSHAITYEDTPEETLELALCMHAYMQVLQFHGSIFDKDSELVTWLLKAASLIMQSQEDTGSVGDDYRATAAFCGVMLMCAHNFEKYDKVLASSYQSAAQKAWIWLMNHKVEDKDALFYAASAQFHCKLGTDVQSKQIVLSYFDEAKGHLIDSYFSIFGSIMYLSTEKGTDRDLCHVVMQEIVNQTEKICEKQKNNPYLVYDTNPDENMKQLMLICFVDYVSPSNEYAVVMENSLHYYGGRNQEGNAYLSADGIWVNEEYKEIYTPIWNGIVINCLSSLIDNND